MPSEKTVDKMRKNLMPFVIAAACAAVTACGGRSEMSVEHHGEDTSTIRITAPTKYLLLPVEESCGDARVMLVTGEPTDVAMDVRLARNDVDYYVPLALPAGAAQAEVRVEGIGADALCWERMSLSDEFDTSNTDYYRPVYHHTPAYGWMNDANGLVYKDGEYHLYYQYNPYGSTWGNMHWGHSVSRDLMHWEPQPPALERDTLGHIFSGSAVVDRNNDAGFGEDAVIAFYTSASDRNGQIQCLAYSSDNGRTFTKYEGNPILTPFDGLRDFRDPKVFWYEPAQRWYMIVSADKQMRFYTSHDMKRWDYVSAFGEGYGAQPCQFECPDFVELPVEGGGRKWVMIVNVNPGCMFGGSATEYFVGDFDGQEFVCDSAPETVKWLDYGKDHYATVCFSNTGRRVIAVPWMSNWQYANETPFMQHRGANALPRELRLYTKDGATYVAADVVGEARLLRGRSTQAEDMSVTGERHLQDIVSGYGGAFELEVDITPGSAGRAGVELRNVAGEKTDIYLDMKAGRLVMDRTQSGTVDFGERSGVHAKENHDGRKRESVNYVNDFALGTWAPLSLCEGGTYHLDIFVDRSSVEIFVDGGRIAMTNLVFPTEPYDGVSLYAEDGSARFSGVKAYELRL